MELFYAISAFVNALTSGLLAFWVYFSRKETVGKVFAFFSFSITFWSIAYIFWPVAETMNEALISFRFLHIGAVFVSVAYLHFVSVWLDIYHKTKKIIFTGYAIAIVFIPFIFTDYFIKEMIPKFSMKFWAVPGFLYHFYLLFFFSYALYSFFILSVAYKKSTNIKKKQIKYVLFGLIIGYLGASTNYFLWYNINIPPFGNILVSVYIIMTAYAIVKHQLMDIKFVIRRSTVHVLSFSITILLALLLRYLLIFIFPHLSLQHNFIRDILVLVFSLYIFPIVSNRSYKFANKYFFTSLYNPQEVIAEMSDKLRTTLSLKTIFQNIAKSLMRVFRAKAFAVLIFNEEKKEFSVAYSKGFYFDKNENLEFHKRFDKYFIAKAKTIAVDHLKEEHYHEYKNSIDFFIKNKVELITPLSIKKKILGYILFGSKESGDMYNEDDLKVLDVVGAQAAAAIDNSLLYEEVRNFNLKLEKEVDKATKDLKKANLQLKKLDEAKSDFISIASHQLRTPLTVIKGYISMILEGSFGNLDDKISETLSKVYESNERLINLVEDLLNISRIESGRLQYVFEKNDLKEVADSVFLELNNSALKKGLKLIYDFEDKKMYRVKIDAEKLRQVVMNLIDNAIKYTFKAKGNKGEIKIFLKAEKKNIIFCVEDNGLGISKEDMGNLFKKFSRGKGMFIVHTNGTGLGLYVAKQIVEAHSGKIWAESEGINKGARFCFKLSRA
jgi:signal transduction histidine kinase